MPQWELTARYPYDPASKIGKNDLIELGTFADLEAAKRQALDHIKQLDAKRPELRRMGGVEQLVMLSFVMADENWHQDMMSESRILHLPKPEQGEPLVESFFLYTK